MNMGHSQIQTSPFPYTRRKYKKRAEAEYAGENFLNEHNLGKLLSELYPCEVFQRGKQVTGSGCRMRPDFQCEKMKMLVEFDGFRHYTDSEKVFFDRIYSEHFERLGLKVVRIPYFVQPCASTVKILFDLDVEYPQKYPHGFQDENIVPPADFCCAGIERFLEDLERFSCIKDGNSEFFETVGEKVGPYRQSVASVYSKSRVMILVAGEG
jgi:very-short-patch-repair endonuclease